MQHLKSRIKSVWSPDMYHGWSRQKNYFEGWYFKLVDPSEQFAFAVIPGISMAADGEKHAFTQVLDGKSCKAYYFEYEAEAFLPHKDKFELRLENNLFSADLVVLDLPMLKGRLKLSNRTAWPMSYGAPGIMGWYSFVPFMQCYHGVVSMDSDLNGRLQVGEEGKSVSFDGGKAYLEKDWGTSFPKSWIWMQSNHFDSPRTSFMFSLAHIPWLGSYFNGFIGGLWLEDKLYKFATYTGAKVSGQTHGQTVEICVRQKNMTLHIHAKHKGGGALVSPIQGTMKGKVDESLQSTIDVELVIEGKTIFKGRGRNAGLELAGEIESLLK